MEKTQLSDMYFTGIQLVKEICGANVTGLCLGSTEVEFHPGCRLHGAEYAVDAVAGFVQCTPSENEE